MVRGLYRAGLAIAAGALSACASLPDQAVHYSAYACTPIQYSARVASGLNRDFSQSGWNAVNEARILACPVPVAIPKDSTTLAGQTVQVSVELLDLHAESGLAVVLYGVDESGTQTRLGSRATDSTGTGATILRIMTAIPDGQRYLYFTLALPARTQLGTSRLLGYRVVVE